MLHRLKFEVTFPSTGRTFAGEHTFEPGLTAITGPNEVGKSLRLELIRWLLFGAEALRGAGGDYKKLHGELEFTAKGERYKVVRNGKPMLYREQEVIATGTSAINKKVVEILGFGLIVFDVACACNQGAIEALGAMRPAERKKMVDSTIGLSILDDLVKWCGEEANALSNQAEGMRRGMVEPVEPVKPSTYMPSGDLAKERDLVLALVKELNEINGWLSVTHQPPEKPRTGIVETAAELKRLVDERASIEAQLNAARARLAALPTQTGFSPEDVGRMEGELRAWDLWQEKVTFLRRNEVPNLTLDQIWDIQRSLATNERIQERDHLRQTISNLRAGNHHECPSCHHTWPVERVRIDQLEARLMEEYQGLPFIPLPVEYTQQQLSRELRLTEHWMSVADEWVRLADVPEVPKPKHTQRDVDTARRAIETAEERYKVTHEIKNIILPPDRNSDLHARLIYEAQAERYEKDVAEYQAWRLTRTEKEARASIIKGAPDLLLHLNGQWQAALAYENSAKAYETGLQAFQQRKAAVEELEAKADQWRKGKAAIALLKDKVKQHLVPSLNRVASLLIAQMTNGKRRLVEVSEDFEVMVDGQPLSTLSGSGKAVANLAIRIGLGQVLTNGVFSVFLGDELDASMDGERAEATATCLRGLTSVIKQVVLVSHKEIEADHYLALSSD